MSNEIERKFLISQMPDLSEEEIKNFLSDKTRTE